MVRSAEILNDLQKVLPLEDWKSLESVVAGMEKTQGRRARKNIVADLNRIIIATSLKNNKPELLLALQEIQSNEIDELFSCIIKQYITTKDSRWLKSVFSLSEKISKKSNQSRVFAIIARDLIDAGVSEAAPELIDQGMIVLDRISFRKYRSDIMIDIIPLLIVWAITTRNKKILSTSLFLIEEIGDISKRAVLHAELAKALATISILEKDRPSFYDSIRSATTIHQKIRRQDCITGIIEKGAKSLFGKEMTDIPEFMRNFSDVSHEAYLEIISALTEQLLERVKDKKLIISILEQLCSDKPDVTGAIVIDLLKKAERSGDPWFLSTAMDLQQHISDDEVYPIREMVRAGISVARSSNNMLVLSGLIPVINQHCSNNVISRIYLQFSQIMLSSGDFSSALGIFGKIDHETENLSPYAECLIHLLKEGILNDSIPLIYNNILMKLNKDVVNNAIYRATIEVCKECAFKDLIAHVLSIRNLILLHPKQDHLLLESITILVDRGFLDSHDPSILIRLAESIQEQSIKERAISNIVIKIAKIGVKAKNRDFLQRAVGLTCEIDGQNTRSAALSSIIDEASILAAQQGDLDLLLRMKVWSNSLLEKDLASYAMANIIDGVIKYAIDRQSCEALEEAYLIADDIHDPSLKAQLFERIAECFVKIGCINLKKSQYPPSGKDYKLAFLPFERGLEIIKNHLKSPQISLKIAGIIDIIISYSKTSNNLDYIIPLAIYATEIENSYERDAMMSRIISSLHEDITHPNSTDPYETMAFLLRRNEISDSNPLVIGLLHRILHLINDPYVKLMGLCDLADLLTRLQKTDQALQVLEEVIKNLKQLPAGYQKVLVLSYLATSYIEIDPVTAEKFLMQATEQLDSVEFDKDAMTRRQIVFAMVRLNTVNPEKKWYEISLGVIKKITEPLEYVNSLIAVYNMARQDETHSGELIKLMEDVVDKITSPYEKASVLLTIIPLTIQNFDDERSLALLKKTEILTKKINIQSIADNIRNNIVELYSALYQKNQNKNMLTHAIQITKTIDDDEIRLYRLEQMGYTEMYEITPQFVKIKSLSEKMVEEGIHPNHVASLERLVRTVADRGKEAAFFCNLSIYFKKGGHEKLSRKMIQNSIKEARIIRPLSRRAYVMCDIALKIYSAGCEHSAQDILDHAIDAATNIRQSSLRDEVFDELGLAIKLMQRM
jgi:tetratricopeptide (TPR) repeat protein